MDQDTETTRKLFNTFKENTRGIFKNIIFDDISLYCVISYFRSK